MNHKVISELPENVNGADANALNETYEREYRKVFRYMYHLTWGDVAKAEDLTQETFFRAFRAHEQLRSDSVREAWLYAIARNEVFKHARYNKARHIITPRWDRTTNEEEGLERQFPDKPNQTEIDQADYMGKLLGKISKEDRSLILLREVHECSIEELAQITGRPQGTIKCNLHRIRQKLLKAAREIGVRKVGSKSFDVDWHAELQESAELLHFKAPTRAPPVQKPLSFYQQAIVDLISEGKSKDEIAGILGMEGRLVAAQYTRARNSHPDLPIFKGAANGATIRNPADASPVLSPQQEALAVTPAIPVGPT